MLYCATAQENKHWHSTIWLEVNAQEPSIQQQAKRAFQLSAIEQLIFSFTPQSLRMYSQRLQLARLTLHPPQHLHTPAAAAVALHPKHTQQGRPAQLQQRL